MKRTNQGGSIGGFIIVGVVLAVLFIGGVYALKTYVAPQQQGDTVAVGENSATEGEATPSESSAENQADSSSGDAANEETASSDTSATETEQAPSTSGTAGAADSESADSDDVATTSGRYAGELPETGPAETIAGALGVFFLTGAALMYQQSRRIGARL